MLGFCEQSAPQTGGVVGVAVGFGGFVTGGLVTGGFVTGGFVTGGLVTGGFVTGGAEHTWLEGLQ